MIYSDSRCALRTAVVLSFLATSFVLALPALATVIPEPSDAIDAIIGTGKDASTNAIIGTGKDASTNAIIGTGKAASTNAIIGTGKDASTNAIIGTGRGDDPKTTLAGPIEGVDASLGTVTVHSRTLQVSGDTALLGHLSSELLGGRSPQVSVSSEIGTRGELVRPVLLFVDEQYVAGVSEVVVSGRVTSIDATNGLARIGAIAFDYTSLLSTADIDFRVGSLVRVRGTQPQPGEAILATKVSKVPR
jgi:hypothetical protein